MDIKEVLEECSILDVLIDYLNLFNKKDLVKKCEKLKEQLLYDCWFYTI